MKHCRGIATPAEAEKFLDAQRERIYRIWERIPKDESGRATEPGFSEFCKGYDEYDAVRRYLTRRGLIWEETEDIYAG